MGCEDVRRIIYFFLDGTLADAKRLDISQHLNLCPDCDKRARIHKRLRDFVQRRVQRVPAPAHLKIRLSRTLRAMVVSLF